MQIGNTMVIRDRGETDELGGCDRLTRVMAFAALRNPFAGGNHDDLIELFEYGAKFGVQLAAENAALCTNGRFGGQECSDGSLSSMSAIGRSCRLIDVGLTT